MTKKLFFSILVIFFCNKEENVNVSIEEKVFSLSKLNRGIDVSHHQGKINWKKVKESGIKFAYIKATEGTNFKDKNFSINWKESNKQNIKTGAYHFFRLCSSGKKQAENFIQTVPKDNSSLNPVIDLELFKNCGLNIEKEILVKEISIFLKLIETHYNQKPIIYFEYDFYLKYMMNEFKDYELWVADIYHSDKPFVPENRNWKYWQYNIQGKISGVNGFVDLNYENKF